MRRVVYLGLDAHMRTCVLAATDSSGYSTSAKDFSTSEAALIHHVVEIREQNKYLAVEESFLAGWIANMLHPYVDELIVCGPRHNVLISRSGNRDDITDAYKLCRLLRMDDLVQVYHTAALDRADSKIVV